MTQTEILEELKKLTSVERLAVAEAALHLVREDFQRTDQVTNESKRNQRIMEAAQVLLSDYQTDAELTAFTALDNEEFCAKG